MAPNKDYWIWRAEQLEQRAAEQGETLIRQALRHYKRAAQEISSQIEEFYGRYAAEQGLSYAEAVKVLRGSEAKAWTKTLGAYVEEIGALPDGALKDRLKAELDARAYSSRITRLDALKAQVDMEVDRLMVNLENEMREGFGDLYTDSYYRKMYDIQRHAGKMFDFAHLDRELVEQALSYPWSGADFSSRLWENKRALLFHLREIMTQGAIQGKGVAALSKELSDKLGQSYKTAERLIRTEANHFHNAADVAAYEAAGVRQYEFIATLDNRTSAVCAGLDGKVFDIKDARTGVNYPPLHPWCRSCTVEYDPDEWKDWEAIGQPMPKRMTYDEWAAERGVEPATKPAEVLNTGGESGKIKAEKKEYKIFHDGDAANQFFYYDNYEKDHGLLAKKKSQYGKWEKALTATQKSAIDAYTTGGYSDLNNFLRKRKDWRDLEAESMTMFRDDLRSVISEFVLKEPIKVYRYTGKDTFGAELVDMIGKEWSDAGFMSTSPVMEGVKNAVVTGKDYLLEIDVPSGKGIGAYLNNLSPWKDQEYEFLLKDGTVFEITDVDTNGDQPIIKMVVKE